MPENPFGLELRIDRGEAQRNRQQQQQQAQQQRRTAIEAERATTQKEYGGFDPYYGIPTEYELQNPENLSRAQVEKFRAQRAVAKREGDLRKMAQDELERARNFDPMQTERYKTGLGLATRTIRDSEGRQLAGLESGLARSGLGQSPLADAMRGKVREEASAAERDTSTRLILQELDTHFINEQAAINRLFTVGQDEAAFFRQAELMRQQADYALRLQKEMNKGSILGGIGEAIGSIGGQIVGHFLPGAGG